MSAILRLLDHGFGSPVIALGGLLARHSTSRPAPKRILVIKLAAVGDSVLLIPVFKSLREAFPEARIEWLISSVNETVARTVPYIDDWHVLRFSPLTLISLIRRLRKRSFDAVIDFEQWARGTALISAAIGSPQRIGFDTEGQHRAGLYTHPVPKRFDIHEFDSFYELASVLGPLKKHPLELFETPSGIQEFLALPLHNAAPTSRFPLVLLHPGCGADGKPRQWPVDSYVRLGKYLQTTYQSNVILTGGPEEIGLTSTLQAALPGSMSLAGQLSWNGLISLVRRMDLVVSGNTGVVHIAAAWQRPQITLHGPTDSRLWGPLNPNARVIRSSCPQCPCLRLGFEYHRSDASCMARISVEEVIDAVRQMS